MPTQRKKAKRDKGNNESTIQLNAELHGLKCSRGVLCLSAGERASLIPLIATFGLSFESFLPPPPVQARSLSGASKNATATPRGVPARRKTKRLRTEGPSKHGRDRSAVITPPTESLGPLAARSSRRRREPLSGRWEDACLAVMERLEQEPAARWFQAPVDPAEAPDYLNVVKTPMDFQTVKEKLVNGMYSHPFRWQEDIRTIFYNAFIYHDAGNNVWSDAHYLAALFEELCKRNEGVNPYAVYAATAVEAAPVDPGTIVLDASKLRELLERAAASAPLSAVQPPVSPIVAGGESRHSRAESDTYVCAPEPTLPVANVENAVGENASQPVNEESLQRGSNPPAETYYTTSYSQSASPSSATSSPYDSLQPPGSSKRGVSQAPVGHTQSWGGVTGGDLVNRHSPGHRAAPSSARKGHLQPAPASQQSTTLQTPSGGVLPLPPPTLQPPPPPPVVGFAAADRSTAAAGSSVVQKRLMTSQFSELDVHLRKALISTVQIELGVNPEIAAADPNFKLDLELLPHLKQRQVLVYLRTLVTFQRRQVEAGSKPTTIQTLAEARKVRACSDSSDAVPPVNWQQHNSRNPFSLSNSAPDPASTFALHGPSRNQFLMQQQPFGVPMAVYGRGPVGIAASGGVSSSADSDDSGDSDDSSRNSDDDGAAGNQPGEVFSAGETFSAAAGESLCSSAADGERSTLLNYFELSSLQSGTVLNARSSWGEWKAKAIQEQLKTKMASEKIENVPVPESERVAESADAEI